MPKNTAEAEAQIKNVSERVADSTTEAYKVVQEHAVEFLDCATDTIRRNPLTAVVGALGVGVALGCLLVSSRGHSINEDTFVDLGDSVTHSLSRLFDQLKFW